MQVKNSQNRWRFQSEKGYREEGQRMSTWHAKCFMFMEMKLQKRQKGFSVVELLIVLLLVGLVSAMTISLSYRNKNRWALRGTAREITTIFHQAKSQASRENSPVMLDFQNNTYSLYMRRNNNWVLQRSMPFGAKVTMTKTPADPTGFAISSSGFIINPDTMNIWGMQTLSLQAPRGVQIDEIVLIIYPYGGLRVRHHFK